MQITLLPPILSTQSPVAVPAPPALTPGMKVQATVLDTTSDGGALLLLGGRQVASSGVLSYPPGTTLHFEVVNGGERPLLRLVGSGSAAGASPTGATSASTRSGTASPAPADVPPLSPATYGLAAAVIAARSGGDVRAAAMGLAPWVPVLVGAGILSPLQGDGLLRALAPVRVPAPHADPPEGRRSLEGVANAIRERVVDSGVLLERRLADLLRQPGPAAQRAAANDVRARLALLADALQDRPVAMPEAQAAVARVQEALLGEQARAAAHLARDGVLDVRVPLQVAGEDAEMRLRMRVARDAADGHDADPAPWRHVRLDLTLEGLGRVQVLLGLAASHVQAEFVVGRAEVADLIEARLVELGTSMQAAGFARLLSRVVVDPVRVSAPDQLPDLPALGEILDAQA